MTKEKELDIVQDGRRWTVDGMPRAEWIRKQIESGASKSAVAKMLDVPYQVIFQACKPKPEPKAEMGKSEGKKVAAA